MILSYNPVIEADKNLLCAGRLPDEDDHAVLDFESACTQLLAPFVLSTQARPASDSAAPR